MSPKKLYRSRENVMLAGVCAGLADYFDIDPSLVRLAAVALLAAGGSSLLAYIAAWIIVPQKPLDIPVQSDISTSDAKTE
jgi:phage shock protein C